MKRLLFILCLFASLAAAAQGAHEPERLILDSSITAIPDFSQYLVGNEYKLMAQPEQKRNRTVLVFAGPRGNVRVAYNYALAKSLPDPGNRPEKFVTTIEVEGMPEALLEIYQRLFHIKTTLEQQKDSDRLRFNYKGRQGQAFFKYYSIEKEWKMAII